MEDRRWEIEDGDKKIWVTKFQHPPSPGYSESFREQAAGQEGPARKK